MPRTFLVEAEVEPYNFTVSSTQISICNQTSNINVTTYEIQISVSEKTPTLIPKCVVGYNHNFCSSLNTFFVTIIPSIDPTTPTTEEPTSSNVTTWTSQVSIETSESDTVDFGERCFPEATFGSGIGVLGILFTIETAILMALLIIWLFYKCKMLKTQAVSDDVTYMNSENNVVESRDMTSKNKTTPAHAKPIKTHDIPNLVQDDDI